MQEREEVGRIPKDRGEEKNEEDEEGWERKRVCY